MNYLFKIIFGYGLLLVFAGLPDMSTNTAEAVIRAGRGVGGGFRTTSRTTIRPGAGVTRTTTVAGGRYHTPTTLPARTYVPGTGVGGVARRTAPRTSARVAYRTASGYSYYYGSPVVVLPTPACYSVIWQGMSAYNCNGAIYILENGQYFPIEG